MDVGITSNYYVSTGISPYQSLAPLRAVLRHGSYESGRASPVAAGSAQSFFVVKSSAVWMSIFIFVVCAYYGGVLKWGGTPKSSIVSGFFYCKYV
jgi:hypothetical protein